jgi:hypothetical protein
MQRFLHLPWLDQTIYEQHDAFCRITVVQLRKMIYLAIEKPWLQVTIASQVGELSNFTSSVLPLR